MKKAAAGWMPMSTAVVVCLVKCAAWTTITHKTRRAEEAVNIRVTTSDRLRSVLLSTLKVDLVRLEASDELVETTKDPGTGADSRRFEDQTDADNGVDERIGKEGKGEGRGNDFPGEGTNNGGDNSSGKTRVQESLEAISDTKDVLVVVAVGWGGDTGDDEYASGNEDLTSNQESLQVLPSEGQLTVLVGNSVMLEFLLWEFDDSEESNLHTLHHTDDSHQDEQDNDRHVWRDALPHTGLAIEESSNGNGKGESEDSQGHHDTDPEEEYLDSRARWLVGVDCLAGDLGENHLDKVDAVEKTGELNSQRDVGSEEHEVVVDEVKHAVGSVDLSSQLTNHDSSQNNSNTVAKKDVSTPGRKTKDGSTLDGGNRQVEDGNDKNDEVLTSNNETLHVVSLVDKGGVLQGAWVGLSVESLVDRLKTDESSLSSFHHGEPDDEEPEDEESSSRVEAHVSSSGSLLAEKGSVDNEKGEHQEARGVKVLERLQCSSEDRAWGLRVLLGLIDQLLLGVVLLARAVSRVAVRIGNREHLAGLVRNKLIISVLDGKRVDISIVEAVLLDDNAASSVHGTLYLACHVRWSKLNKVINTC